MALEAGTRLGHYEILSLLGEGGMGEVYLAHDTKLDRNVALKFLPPKSSHDQKARKRLIREAQAAAKLDHINICTIYEVGEVDNRSFIAMQYLEGETLGDRLGRKAMEFSEVLDIGLQVAEALEEAHSHSIIHRDIKPLNIMITERGRAMMMDFGLARVTQDSKNIQHEAPTQSRLTSPQTVLGTLHYMSPEQTRGEPLDARSDLFSLAVVLYEAATGRIPFNGKSALAIMHEISEVDPTPPSTIRTDLPPLFDSFIARALAKDKEQRYGSASQLTTALNELRQAATDPDYAFGMLRSRTAEAFVGREPEMKRLLSILSETIAGTGRTVFITGEPGIGKTSLADAFMQQTRQNHHGLILGRGRCVEQYGTGEAYLPLLDALGSLINRTSNNRILTALRTYAPTWCLQFPAAFVSTGEREQLQRETIGATKERMMREMGDMLEALSVDSPIVLLLEDLHWADSSSTDLLRYLSQRTSTQRLLIVGTFRPEDLERSNHPLKTYRLEMQAQKLTDEIALGLFGEENVSSYLAAHFTPNNFPRDLAALIQKKTEGHPLFATSLVQFLSEHGDIAKVAETWTLIRPLAELDLEVPESVRSMILKKIEVLSDGDRRVLQYASIEGEEFTSTVLARLLDVDELELEERLDVLARVHRLIEMLGEEELPDGSLTVRYRFAHALYQNVVYANLLSKRRTLLHRQAGQQLLQLYGDQSSRVAPQLAIHFERGREFSRAVEYLIRAGDNAAELYANPEAEEHYSRALRLVEKLSSEEQTRNYLALYQKRGTLNIALSRFEEAFEDLSRMRELARVKNSPALECTALSTIVNVLFQQHRLPEMGVYGQEALRAAEAAGSENQRIATMAQLAQRHIGLGELAQSSAITDEVIRIARSLGDKSALLSGLIYRGIVHFFQTEYVDAEKVLRETRELAVELRDGFMVPYCSFFLSLVLGNLGRISEALTILNDTLEICRRNGNHMVYARVINSKGWLYRELGDVAGAIELNKLGVATARQYRMVEAEANSLINLGQDYTRCGEQQKSLFVAREAEEIFERDEWNRWRFYHIRFETASAERCLQAGDLEGADDHARRLLDNATHHRVPKYIAIAHGLLSEIAIAKGRVADAVTYLNSAVDQLNEHPAPLVAWKTYAALGRAQVLLDEHQAALASFKHSAAIVNQIAGNTHDEVLRNTFLTSTAVAQVHKHFAIERQ